jgi:hypothetical protein
VICSEGLGFKRTGWLVGLPSDSKRKGLLMGARGGGAEASVETMHHGDRDGGKRVAKRHERHSRHVVAHVR